MNLILDASMALAWIFERSNPEEKKKADKLLLSLQEYEVVVPTLWHTEIANALLVGERRKILTEAQVIDYINRLSKLPIMTDSASPISRREPLMALARRHSLTAYDATYLDLALRLGATLATFDKALAKSVMEAGAELF